jgi:hypothetical protein
LLPVKKSRRAVEKLGSYFNRIKARAFHLPIIIVFLCCLVLLISLAVSALNNSSIGLAKTDMAMTGGGNVFSTDILSPAPAIDSISAGSNDDADDATVFASTAGALSMAPDVGNPLIQGPTLIDKPDDTGLPQLPPDYQDPDDDGYIPGAGMTISGRVTDPWGRGIPDVEVEAVAASYMAGIQPVPFRTDANGYYSVQIYAPGYFKLKFSCAGWVGEWYNNKSTPWQGLAVPNGASGVDAVLIPAGVLHGHINFPVAPFDIKVFAYRADVPQVAGNSVAYTLSLHPSDFYFLGRTSLLPGQYKLLLRPDNPDYAPFWYGGTSWVDAQTLRVTAGQTTEIEINLASPPTDGGAIYGSLSAVIDYNIDDTANASVYLVDADDENQVIATDDSPPYFEFPDLPPGDYKLKATVLDDKVIWYRQFSEGDTYDSADATVLHVNAGESIQASFFISTQTARITGRVIRESGTEVANARLNCYRDGSMLPENGTISGISGSFYLALRPGTYRICVVDPDTGTEHCREPLTIGWLQTISDIDFLLPGDVTIQEILVEPGAGGVTDESEPAEPVTDIATVDEYLSAVP